MSTSPQFNKIALIGIGLIGSSLSHVIRQKSLAKTIAISTRRAETLDEAKSLNLGDIYSLNAVDIVKDADLVILCVPVGAMGAVIEGIKPSIKPGAIVTDVGSVKQSVVDQVLPHLDDDVHFIPSHPIAGTEHSGPASGFASLFQNRWCIITPLTSKRTPEVELLKSFWEACGSKVSLMDTKQHDLVLAMTSHIPHLIAYNIVGTADDLESVTKSDVITYSAAGFRDFTRIAASDPTMWRDIFLHNKDAVLEILGRFTEDLSVLQRAIRWGDGDALFELFSRTREIRRSIIEAGQETEAPNFGRNIIEQDDKSAND